jgi:hypothetical protein
MKSLIKNRYLRILLLPIVAVIFVIGFAAYVQGEPKKQKTNNQHIKQPSQNATPTIEIGVLIPQEEQVQTVCDKTEKE